MDEEFVFPFLPKAISDFLYEEEANAISRNHKTGHKKILYRNVYSLCKGRCTNNQTQSFVSTSMLYGKAQSIRQVRIMRDDS